MIRYLRLFVVAFGLLIAVSSFAEAAQLVMIDSRACGYCQRFKHDIAPSYSANNLGKRAPLRVVSVWKKWPQDLKSVKPVRFTPVFILVNQGKEVGRFYGYSGRADFWARLEVLLTYL